MRRWKYRLHVIEHFIRQAVCRVVGHDYHVEDDTQPHVLIEHCARCKVLVASSDVKSTDGSVTREKLAFQMYENRHLRKAG